MISWKLCLRDLRTRPGRALLTLSSVVIGVAAVLAVALVTATTRRAYSEMYQCLAGRADLEVVAQGDRGVAESLLPELEQIPGVRAVRPLIQRPTMLYYDGKKVKLLVLGIDATRENAERDFELAAGSFLDGDQGVLLGASLAQGLGVTVEDKVKILTRIGVRELTVSGLLAPRGAAQLQGGGLVVLPIRRAQRLLGRRGSVDAVQLELAAGVTAAEMTEAVAQRLPAGLLVRPPSSRNDLAQETLAATDRLLHMAGVLSLVAAAFVIFNTFLMNVTDRRRQLAILRAIGGTRRQVMRLLLREGLLLGVVGTLVGVPLGLGGAYLLTKTMEQLLQTTLPAAHLAVGPYVLAAALGVGVSLLATYLPARQAGRISPLEGLQPIIAEAHERVPRRLTLGGMVLLLLAGGAAWAASTERLPVACLVPAQLLALAGGVLLIPVLLGPVARVLALLLGPLLGVASRLAERELMRRRLRSTLTVGVLFIAMSVGIAIGTLTVNNMQDVERWLHTSYGEDFFVFAMLPDIGTGLGGEVPPELGDELQQLDGISRIHTLRFVTGEAAGHGVIAIVHGLADGAPLPLNLSQGEPAEVLAKLYQGEVVIGTQLAQRTGLLPGDQIEVQGQAGPQALRIAGIANEYYVGGVTLHLERAVAQRLLGVAGIDAIAIDAQPNSRVQLETDLRAYCQQHGLLFMSQFDLRQLLDRLSAGFLAGLWVLLILGFLVAALGILNTLTMNVIEQTRELGLLRVVGMARRQVRRMILCQAGIMAGAGLLPGTAAGVGMAYLVDLSALPLYGHPVQFQVWPMLLGGSLLAAVAIVLGAAWLPAERAARLQISEALQYE